MAPGPRPSPTAVLCTVLFACGLSSTLFASPAGAGSFQTAQSEIDGRLKDSLQELAQVRGRIAGEKLPLSRAVAGLEDEVLALRQEQARLLKLRDSRSIDLTSLRRQVASMGEQQDFIESRLDEFARDFEGRLDISELPHYEALTAAAKLSGKNVNLDAEGGRRTQIRVVEAALQRLRDQLGGHVFAGHALSPDGVLTEGTFVSLGPVVFYASRDGSVRGLVENRLNAADPVVVDLPDGLGAGIVDVARNGSGELPLDATLGKAVKTEKARKSLAQHIDDGGLVGYVIIALGATALALALFKAWEILGSPMASTGQLDGILGDLARGDRDAAVRRAGSVEGAAGRMLATGVEHAGEKRGVLEELIFEEILRARPTLERFLPFLAITAAAAPLLGLLGTVIGMIKTFQLITIFGTGDAKSLSSGISEALVTTALGLIVAIPTLIGHGALSRMARRKLGLLEQLSVAFVNGVMAIRTDPETGWKRVTPKLPRTPSVPASHTIDA
jgi:biopolymer transport protein ExbB